MSQSITMRPMTSRLANLLGAEAVAVTDAMRTSTERAAGHLAAAPAALVAIDAHPGESLEVLRTSVGLTPSGAVRLVDRLAADGLVERRSGTDGRSIALHLTVRGSATVRDVARERARALEDALAPLGARERRRLEGLLEKLVARTAADRPDALAVCRLCDREACRSGAACPLDHTVAST